MELSYYDAPGKMAPTSSSAQFVPFGRSRNRKTMQEYDFLLNTIEPGDYDGNGGNDSAYKEPEVASNDHAAQIFKSVRKSQAMHELNAPRLLAPGSFTGEHPRRGIGRRRSFDSAVGNRSGREKNEPQRLPPVSGRDDARLLNNAFDSLLTRWSQNVPGNNPKRLIKKFVGEGNVQATLNILDPELRILKATMVTLTQQVAGKCIEQADLMERVESRYRRAIRVLIQLSQQVQIYRSQVAQRIPQIEHGRTILIDAVLALRESVESTVAAGDGRVDRSKFQNALSRLAANTFDQPRNPEVRELRKLELAVSNLQQGRIQSDTKLIGVEKELNKFRLEHEKVMNRVAEDMKVLQKTLTSLRRNEGMTRKNRDDHINQSIDDAYQRAQAIAAGTVTRLEKENGNLQQALTQVQRQMTQAHFESDLSFADSGVQCDITGEEETAEAAKNAKTQKKKDKADAKKRAKQEKKKNKKNKNKSKKGKDEEKQGEEEEEEEVEEGREDKLTKEDDNKMMDLKIQVQKLSHLVLEKETQIQYLQQMIPGAPGAGNMGGGGSTRNRRERKKKSTGSVEDAASNAGVTADRKAEMKTTSTQYETNPIPLDESTGERNGSKGGKNKDGKVGGRGKRPQRRKRAGAAGGGGGVGVVQAAPDPQADMRWARCWMSVACAAAALPPSEGGLQPGVPFTDIMRREMLKICGTQGFGDLVMCLIVDIVRKKSSECRLLTLFSILLGMEPVKPMESGDDTGIKSEGTEGEEFHAIVIHILALARADQHVPHGRDQDEHDDDSEHSVGVPMLVPAKASNYRCSIKQTKKTVAVVCAHLGIPKPMAKSYVAAAAALGEGFSREHAVDVCDIIDIVDGAWRDQYGRRKVQLGAQYSMASATTNWFSRVDATQALMKMEPTFEHEDADEVYRSAVNMIRNYNAVTSTNSSTKTNPGVSIRTLMPALIRASWMHLKGRPRWVPSPARLSGGEDLLSLVNESMSAMPRHMASLMQKFACKQLRKLMIRMKHELKDAMSSIDEHAIGSYDYAHVVSEHGERLMVLMQEIGSFSCGQDETTVRNTLKELTGR